MEKVTLIWGSALFAEIDLDSMNLMVRVYLCSVVLCYIVLCCVVCCYLLLCCPLSVFVFVLLTLCCLGRTFLPSLLAKHLPTFYKHALLHNTFWVYSAEWRPLLTPHCARLMVMRRRWFLSQIVPIRSCPDLAFLSLSKRLSVSTQLVRLVPAT